MIAKITVLCFFASYAVAWLLEVSRLYFRSGVRGALMVGFAVAGLVAHSLFLGHRALQNSTTPLSSEFDFYLLAAWVLAAMYLYLTAYHPRNPIGLFVLPLVLLFVAAAWWFANQQPFPRTTASLWWGSLHGVCLLLGTVAVTVGFVTGLMYLVQANRLKHKRLPGTGLKLPSLEWLQRMNSRTIGISVLMLGAGFLAGIVLNLINHREQDSWVPWTDPVVLSSSILVGWMVVAWLFSLLYKPAQQGRKVAYLTVASFVFLVVSLVAVLAETKHGVDRSSIEHTSPTHERGNASPLREQGNMNQLGANMIGPSVLSPRLRVLMIGLCLPQRGLTNQPRASEASPWVFTPSTVVVSPEGAVRGRHGTEHTACYAPLGLTTYLGVAKPRAALRLPWAVVLGPFRAGMDATHQDSGVRLVCQFYDHGRFRREPGASALRLTHGGRP